MEAPAAQKPSVQRPRRRPTRAHVPPAEKTICIVLLVLIPLAGLALYRKGQRYDPHLYSLDPALVHALTRRTPQVPVASGEPGEDAAGAAQPAPPAGIAPAPALGGFAVPGVPPSALVGTPPGLPGFPQALPPANLAGAAAAPPAMAAGQPAPAAQRQILGPSLGDPAWAMSGGVQRFRPDNLYEKIDGRAEQYLQYGVAGLEAATYADQKDPGRSLDVFVYDMARPTNAFGIYSVERPRGAKSLKLGEQAYRADASHFFTRGRYYVQVVASDRGPALQEAGLKLARHLDAALAGTASGRPPQAPPASAASPPQAPPAPSGLRAQAPKAPPGSGGLGGLTPRAPPGSGGLGGLAPKAPPGSGGVGGLTPRAPPGSGGLGGLAPKAPPGSGGLGGPRAATVSPAAMMALFPKDGLVPESSQYLMKDALGLDFLTDVYTMRYKVKGTEYTLFLTRRGSESDARALVDKYVDFLVQFGKLAERQAEGQVSFLVGDVSGYADAVFRAGPFFGGANGARDPDVAKELSLRLLRSVAKAARGLVPEGAARMEHWPGAGESTGGRADGGDGGE